MRRMEAVIHARFQPQRRIAAVAISFDEILIAEQIPQRVWKPFGLVHLGAGNFAASPDNRVAGTDQDLGALVDRADAILEFADETIVQAIELLLLGLAEIEIGKQP